MSINKSKELVQQKAVQTCMGARDSSGRFRGTCEIATGTGKTFIAFWLIHYLKPHSVLFLAETTLREENILKDMAVFKKYYDIDIEEDYDIEFACYQGAYKWENHYYDLVVADEFRP